MPQNWNSKLRTGVIIFFLTLLSVKNYATAQGSTWQDLKLPSYGKVTCLKHSGVALFAGMESGRIFRSEDEGTIWRRVSGLADAPIQDFLFHDSIYLAASGMKINLGLYDCFDNCGPSPTVRGKLFRSTDFGKTWKSINRPAVTALAVLGNNFYAATLSGIYRSTDYGLTWKLQTQTGNQSIHPAIFGSGQAVRSLTVFDGKLMFDEGGSLYFALPNKDTLRINSVPLDVTNVTTLNGLLYVTKRVTTSSSQSQNLFRTNNGVTWDSLGELAQGRIFSSGKNLYHISQNILSSVDSGQSWNVLPNSAGVGHLTLAAYNSNLFVDDPRGAVKIFNLHDSSWKACGAGLYDSPVSHVELRGDAVNAIVESFPRFTKSTNTKWQTNFSDPFSICTDCFFFSSEHWRGRFNYDNSFTICDELNSCDNLPRTRLPATSNYGALTRYKYFPLVHTAAASGDTILAAVDSLYRSTDRGHTWSMAKTLPGTNPTLSDYNGIWKLGVTQTQIIAGISKDIFALYSSKDAGSTWTLDQSASLPRVNASVSRENETYLATDSGVYLYSKSSSTFKNMGPITDNSKVQSIALSGTRLVIGMYESGVYELELNPSGLQKAAHIKSMTLNSQPLISHGEIFQNQKWMRVNGQLLLPRKH